MSGTPVDNAIRRLRFENGEMTQQALADACGITRQTVIALEARRYAPSLELAFRIAHVFSVGLDEVFQWQTGPNREGAVTNHRKPFQKRSS